MLFENWKLKIDRRSSLNSVFKHPKMRNVTQTLQNEISYQTPFFFSHSFQYLNTKNCCLESLTKQALESIIFNVFTIMSFTKKIVSKKIYIYFENHVAK